MSGGGERAGAAVGAVAAEGRGFAEASGDGRLRLVLAEPEGPGGLTPALVERLLARLGPACRARLVTLEGGAPGSFCEGLALDAALAGEDSAATAATAGGAAAHASDGLARFAALLDAIGRTPCPVIALVGGPALGGGLGLAAACDLVIAAPRARFGLPEAVLGLLPAVVLPHVARRVGVARARLLALGLGSLDAPAALAMGLADEVASDLEAALVRHVRRLARLDPRALAAVKGLVAEHFAAAPAAYEAAARARFADLLASAPTQARLARVRAGEPAWGDGEGEGVGAPLEDRP